MLFPATFNLPVFTKANMNAFVAAPKLRRSLRSCSRIELASDWSKIKVQKMFCEIQAWSVQFCQASFPVKSLSEKEQR